MPIIMVYGKNYGDEPISRYDWPLKYYDTWSDFNKILDKLVNIRKEAVQEHEHWRGIKKAFNKETDKEWAKFVKDLIREHLRIEKACTLIYDFFIKDMGPNKLWPIELYRELDRVSWELDLYDYELSQKKIKDEVLMAFPFGDPHPCSSIPILVIDGETSFSLTENGKTDPSPFNEANIFVSCGYKYVKYNRMSNTVLQISNYLCFNHNHQEPTVDGPVIMQQAIDEAKLIVGHNLKFDLEWLAEAGFNIEGKYIWDTMIAEYVLGRGDLDHSLKLDDLLKARNLGWKSPILENFIKKGYSTEDVPWNKLSHYGQDDIEKTHRIFEAQVRDFYNDKRYASFATLSNLLSAYDWDKLIDTAEELKNNIKVRDMVKEVLKN